MQLYFLHYPRMFEFQMSQVCFPCRLQNKYKNFRVTNIEMYFISLKLRVGKLTSVHQHQSKSKKYLTTVQVTYQSYKNTNGVIAGCKSLKIN